MVGSDVDEVTVNALLELVSPVISRAEVPEFLMEMFWEAPVPTFTSPKSTDAGVATTGSAFVDENAREFDPQPVIPRVNSMEQARAAAAHTR